jgi:hypothetical protein
MFKQGNPGCPCCACNWTITVRGACTSEVLSGRTVSLYQSAVLIASGTTNGSGVVVLNVPAGSYDVTVSSGGGYAAYSASGTSHTCSDSTTITLSVASGRLCFACGTCLAIPTSLSLTWLSHTGGAWSGPDDTLAYDSVTHRWVGSTIVTDSSGNTFVQYVSFSGCSFDLCITPAGSNPIPTSRCGGSSAAVSSCDPFHSATGTISGMGTSGTWTLAG